MHRNARENTKLGAGIEAINVGRGIRFRIAKLLRIGQHSCVIGTRFHTAEDVVAGAVDDTAEPCNLIAAKSLKHSRDHWNTTCNGGSMHQMNAVLRCELRKTRTTIGDELLIRSYNRFAR